MIIEVNLKGGNRMLVEVSLAEIKDKNGFIDDSNNTYIQEAWVCPVKRVVKTVEYKLSDFDKRIILQESEE
jgi:hypothetical protein